MERQTAVEWLIQKLELFNITKEEHYEVFRQIEVEAKELEKEIMIDFHVEVMKKGLIEEGDEKWSDGYLPLIKEVAEDCFNKIFTEPKDQSFHLES